MGEARLHPFGEGLFHAEAEIGFYGVKLQTRMVVARLEGGALWVYSPLPLTEDLAVQLDALGEVRHVLSPNKIHNQGLAGFAERYPNATVWASPGLQQRRPDLVFEGVLGNAPEPAWQPEIDQRVTAGNCFFEEVVCFHRASKTLVVADLVEWLSRRTLPSPVARRAARWAGIWERPLASPEFRIYTEDAAAARSRLEEIAAWPFERVLLAHGEPIEVDAHGVFGELIEQLCAEVARRPGWRRRLYRAVSRLQ